MSMENWQDEQQLEDIIEELAEEHGVTADYIADHLDNYLTCRQEDNIIGWRENE